MAPDDQDCVPNSRSRYSWPSSRIASGSAVKSGTAGTANGATVAASGSRRRSTICTRSGPVPPETRAPSAPNVCASRSPAAAKSSGI